MSYDPSSRYSTDPLDDELRGLDGLGGYGGGNLYTDEAGNTYDNALALGHTFDSGLDGLGTGGLDSYGSGLSGGGGAYDDPLSGGLGGLSLNTSLDGLNTGLGGSGLDGLGGGGGYDSGYGGLGSGLSGDFGIPVTGGDFLDAPGYGSYNDPAGLGLDSLGSGLGSSGLDDLGDYALGLGGGGLNGGYDSLGSGLDGYDSLGGGLDNYGSLGGGGLDNYGSLEGIGLDSYGSLDSGLGGYDSISGGLDGLGGSAGLGGLDSLGGLAGGPGLAGLDGIGGLGGLDDSLGNLGLDGLGAGSAYMSNYDLGFDDIGRGLDSLGWSSYDAGGLGLDGLGSGYGDSSYLGDAALLGGAALAGGALGAAAGHYAGDHDHLNLDRGLGGGLGYSSNPYGVSNYDTNLGILGSSAFSYGAYDGFGFGSGLGSPTLRYSDLANYENRLYTDQAISAAERQSLLADRMAWEALDDSARLAKWNTWDDGYRSRLGLSDGYWGSRYGNSVHGSGSGYTGYGGSTMYDPMYAAYGWNQPSYSDYSGFDYSYGYGTPSFYNNYSLASVPYGLTSPVKNYYGSYLNTQDVSSLPYWSDDSRWREAADLAYYQQRLQADRALSESERMRRWQQRLGWEALDQDARRLRWAEMAEDQRQRLGLGLIGSYTGTRYGSRGYGMSLPYELPSQLRSVFQPYLSGQGLNTNKYMDTNYTRYNDLVTWANALRYDRKLAESERLQRWRRRMEWEMLDEAERRARWNRMPYKDRAMLGLAGGFYDSRYGLSNFYDPRALRPMRFPVTTTLARMFSPYKSKTFLARALREGQEDAIAFADLVAFENALRADKRLRAEDKLRRWKARVRWQEMNERERRLRYFQMQEAERRMLGLGLSSFFGRRYAAPLFLNGVRGLPPPRASLPVLRAPLPSNLQTVYAPVMARQQPLLSASSLARANTNPDPAKNLADRIRLSIAQKTEQLPGISPAQRLAATEQKRRILREMDNERQTNQSIALTDEQRMRRLRSLGY